MEFIIAVLSSITATLIYVIFQLILKKIAKKRYTYLLGVWHGYYLMKKRQLILEQKIFIRYSLFRHLIIRIEEKSNADYEYKGKLKFVEDNLYGILEGVCHPAKSFIILKLPLNRRELPSINGIFAGITQDKQPAAVKIHISRGPKNIKDLNNEFGESNTYIISKSDTKENLIIKDIDSTIKK